MKVIDHNHYWQVIPALAKLLLGLGLIGGIAFRLTIFVRPLGEGVVTIVWYIGIIAYIIFFSLRVSIENHRREICNEEGLFKRLRQNQLNQKDAQIISEILKSQCKSKIKFNYMAWLALSVVSLIAALFFV